MVIIPSPKSTPPALLLDRQTVAELLPLSDCLAAITRAFAAHGRGETLPTGLLHGEGLGGEFHVKAGGLREPNPYFACKVNSGFFRNRSVNGLPNIQGLVLLYSAANGQPLAVMESAEITRRRTGAATALAALHLAKPGPCAVLIVGAGSQAAIQLEALGLVRPLQKVRVWSRNAERAAEFARRMGTILKLEIEPVQELTPAARSSDIIVTCTPANGWILGKDMVSPGAFVAGVGADSAGKQELEASLVAAASVVTDITEQCARVGDLQHALAAGLMRIGDVHGELGQIVAGKLPGRTDPQRIMVFDSTGTALQDAAAAAVVYENARGSGRGTHFPFWG